MREQFITSATFQCESCGWDIDVTLYLEYEPGERGSSSSPAIPDAFRLVDFEYEHGCKVCGHHNDLDRERIKARAAELGNEELHADRRPYDY